MSGAFTPGPWDADWWQHLLRDLHNFLPSGLRGPADEDDPWGTQTDKFNYPGLTGDDEANARLIASAPDMARLLGFWAALDGGAWHADRHSREKTELLAETNALLLKVRNEQ